MPTKLRPPKYYCKISGLGHDHILRLIQSGELRACNVASSEAKRARWLISEDDWESFLSKRATKEPDRIAGEPDRFVGESSPHRDRAPPRYV